MKPVLLITLLLTLCLLWVVCSDEGLVQVTSGIDNRVYAVRKGPEQQLVADRLGSIRQNLERIVTFASSSPKYNKDHRIIRLVKRWPYTSISETSSNSTDAAFSYNKGQTIAFCVRDKSGALEDLNTSMFVAIHELAHVATAGYNGHDTEFFDTMRFLLKIAIEDVGVYQYRPYETQPTSYCGHDIAVSPFTCYKNGTCSVR
jgi:hypothetical protein